MAKPHRSFPAPISPPLPPLQTSLSARLMVRPGSKGAPTPQELLSLVTPEAARASAAGGFPLHAALMARADSAVLSKLIDAYPAAAAAPGAHGFLPLHYAAANGASDEIIARLLAAAPAAPQQPTARGTLPLHCAASRGSDAVVLRLLAAYPAAARAANHDGQLPLHLALWKRQPAEVVLRLLSAFPEAAREREKLDGFLPLHYALQSGFDAAVIGALLRAWPDAAKEAVPLPEEKRSPLPLSFALSLNASHAVVALVLQAYPEAAAVPDEFGHSALEQACGYTRCHAEHLSIVHAVLSAHPSSAPPLEAGEYAETLRLAKAHKPPHVVGRLVLRADAEALAMKHMNQVDVETCLRRTKAALDAMAAMLAPQQRRTPPRQVAVCVIGAGLTGLSVGAAFAADEVAGMADLALLDKCHVVAGVWTLYGNHFSRVNVSGPGYHLPTTRPTPRASLMHPHHFDILEDALDVVRSFQLAPQIHLQVGARAVAPRAAGWVVDGHVGGAEYFRTDAKLVCICTNRRLGSPRHVPFAGEESFAGRVGRGLGDDTEGFAWGGQRVVIVGFGAYATELMRTALEREPRAEHAVFLARQLTTVLPRVLEWMNVIRPWDSKHQYHPFNGGRLIGGALGDAYRRAGAPQPPQFKPDGGTGLLTDIFFLAYYLQLTEARIAEIERLEPHAVVTSDGARLPAGILIKCVGFLGNYTTEMLIGRRTMQGIGLVDFNLWVKGEPHIDNGLDTLTPLATSIFYSVPWFCQVLLKFYHEPSKTRMALADKAAPRVTPNWFNLSQWVQSYRHYEKDPEIAQMFKEYVVSVANRFHETAHILDYIAGNHWEWDWLFKRLKKGSPAEFTKPNFEYPFEEAVIQIVQLELPHLL
ncbi:hypothetical protein AB1Y20_016012 [Prymnesium parvum]|uniref:Uncharacterized protein n=1 Tax=Prymnesium parvum TaxID=97485 RepID=A0AB34K2K1_PRYPA